MKFTYVPPTPQGWAEIQTSRVDFDAHPPVDRLRVCWPLGEANVDRTAVAASLVFAPWTAGRCDFLQPFSALTGQRITEWFQEAPVWVSPTPIRAGGLSLPRGRRRFRLSGDGGDELRLTLVDSLLGSSESDEEVRVASNLSVLMANAPTTAASFAMRLGVAVLVADSLSVNEFIDPEFAAEAPQSFTHAQRLLESVALGLRDA
ncbi:hypothetical protein V1260_07960 [Brachybacterium sp. J144]|uniref:hypothetical protein n=1 Tax=Brachybacterium sp. J144 TaxID=3116487 RepID=UPI002E786BB7|nr:hypothetical protein [Brachybacterium sp. J144]MEE1650726.1 hypothetical protein [Brachybacterium sp. J144]